MVSVVLLPVLGQAPALSWEWGGVGRVQCAQSGRSVTGRSKVRNGEPPGQGGGLTTGFRPLGNDLLPAGGRRRLHSLFLPANSTFSEYWE